MIARVGAGASAAGQNNVAFLSHFVLGKYVILLLGGVIFSFVTYLFLFYDLVIIT